eukprot:gnl/Chilomastix_caulleri/1176.p1 GENE.gnl/Chilomastix_caulleri/1176~~gnl/Chilomastix_caulleri/1176.p1  ORF type:complete len:135 (+),score=33.83 gnl/Chilomastix_caulleri/1176:247-651(+)
MKELVSKLKIEDELAKSLLNLMDTDGSGEIDYNEFRDFYILTDPRTPSGMRNKIMFSKADIDGSGKIDPDEMMQYLQRYFPTIDRATAEKMITPKMRKNKDCGEVCIHSSMIQKCCGMIYSGYLLLGKGLREVG